MLLFVAVVFDLYTILHIFIKEGEKTMHRAHKSFGVLGKYWNWVFFLSPGDLEFLESPEKSCNRSGVPVKLWKRSGIPD